MEVNITKKQQQPNTIEHGQMRDLSFYTKICKRKNNRERKIKGHQINFIERRFCIKNVS